MQIEAWDSVAKEVDFNLEIDTPKFMHLVPKDTTVLDYGCGYGRTCGILNLLGYSNMHGVDSSPEMIRRGNLKYPHLSLKKTQGATLQYPDGNFGAIVLCAVLTCMPEHQEKQDVLAEIIRLLKPGGILHLVEFCNETSKIFESTMGITMHHQQPSELRSLVSAFTELKFEVIQTQTMGGENAKAVSYFGQKILNRVAGEFSPPAPQHPACGSARGVSLRLSGRSRIVSLQQTARSADFLRNHPGKQRIFLNAEPYEQFLTNIRSQQDLSAQ